MPLPYFDSIQGKKLSLGIKASEYTVLCAIFSQKKKLRRGLSVLECVLRWSLL